MEVLRYKYGKASQPLWLLSERLNWIKGGTFMPQNQFDIPATKEEREAFDEFVKKVEQGLVDSEII